MRIGVAIPAYRDAARLRRCLLSIQNVAPELAPSIVVVDDSGDGSVAEALRDTFPQVHWIVNERNSGFGASANAAVWSCEADVVVLLNDDVELLSDPAPFLRSAFRNPDLFAVTFQSRRADGSFREGAKRLVWPMGMPRILHNERDQFPPIDNVFPSAYAVGGHTAFQREKFLALGGFDPLFEPFYWEDVDLCRRARQHQWKTTYSPESIVMHGNHGAIRSTTESVKIREITMRNRLLFAWRHVPLHLIPLHALSLACQLAASSVSPQHAFLRAFRSARERRRHFNSSSEPPLAASHSKGAHLGKD